MARKAAKGKDVVHGFQRHTGHKPGHGVHSQFSHDGKFKGGKRGRKRGGRGGGR